MADKKSTEVSGEMKNAEVKSSETITSDVNILERLPVSLEEFELDEPIEAPSSLRRPIAVRPMVLMGSGPTNPSKRVTEALCKPIMGLYVSEFWQIMDEVREGLKYLFQTRNAVTFCGTGSGNAGMEIALGNLLEPNDIILVCVSGTFGSRAAEVAKRYQADVRVIESKMGTTFKYEQIRAQVDLHKPKVLFLCHGDSSTGVLQNLNKFGDLCRRNNILFVVDAVVTLGAVDLNVDEYKIDVCFSGSEYVLGAPAGLAPITFSPRAMECIIKRKVPRNNVYFFDATYLSEFYKCGGDKPRMYHHTVSAQVLYALREALAEIVDEGLDLFKLRHAENAQRLWEGLQNIGLELYVENSEQRLPSITTVRIPHGIKMENVMKCMMDRHSVEISDGIGVTKGIIFRIGTMNSNATHQKIDLVLRALYEALKVTANFIAPQTRVYY